MPMSQIERLYVTVAKPRGVSRSTFDAILAAYDVLLEDQSCSVNDMDQAARRSGVRMHV